jgi:hypothetical protein
MTGLQVKRILKVLTGLKVEQQSLLYCGREIDDDDLSGDYQVKNGNTVLDISSFVLMIYLFRLTWLLKRLMVQKKLE